MEKPTETASIPDAPRDTRTPPLPPLPPLDLALSGGPGGPGGSGGLWNRNFRYFFVARTVALFGDGMIPVALTAGLLGAGRPASSVGFALAAWMGPLAVFVLFGGVLADRFTPAA